MQNMTTCLCAMDRVVSKLDKKTGFQDKKDAVDFPKFSEKITFDDVSFYYKKDVYVLHNISFEVKKVKQLRLLEIQVVVKQQLSIFCQDFIIQKVAI